MDKGVSVSRQRQLLGSAMAAAVTTGVIFVFDHFALRKSWSWLDVGLLYVLLFVCLLVAPSVRRFFRGPNGE